MGDPDEDAAHEDPAPFGRSWTTLYVVVFANLVLWITLFWAFTRAFQ
jgi:hypothetical protein